MKEIFNSIGTVCIAIGFIGIALVLNDHEKRLKHLESVTFESSRCPLTSVEK